MVLLIIIICVFFMINIILIKILFFLLEGWWFKYIIIFSSIRPILEKYFDIWSSVFILGLETVGVSCTVWETLIGEIGYKVCKFDLFYNI